MQFLLVLLFAATCFASGSIKRSNSSESEIYRSIVTEVFKPEDFTKFTKSDFKSEPLSQLSILAPVRLGFLQLKSKKEEEDALIVDYGSSEMAVRLEQLTNDVLTNKLVFDIITALTDPIPLIPTNERFKFTFNVTSPELKFCINF